MIVFASLAGAGSVGIGWPCDVVDEDEDDDGSAARSDPGGVPFISLLGGAIVAPDDAAILSPLTDEL
jgi:hypothetical protein